MLWLEREHPELVEKYRYLYYGTRSYAPKEYRQWLAARIKPLLRAHGLERGVEDPTTGGVRSAAIGMTRDANGESRSLIREELAPTLGLNAISQPLLF